MLDVKDCNKDQRSKVVWCLLSVIVMVDVMQVVAVGDGGSNHGVVVVDAIGGNDNGCYGNDR